MHCYNDFLSIDRDNNQSKLLYMAYGSPMAIKWNSLQVVALNTTEKDGTIIYLDFSLFSHCTSSAFVPIYYQDLSFNVNSQTY